MTPRQNEILGFIAEYAARTGGVTPSLREIMDHCGTKSVGTMSRMIATLVRDGHLRRTGTRRALQVVYNPGAVCPGCGRPFAEHAEAANG